MIAKPGKDNNSLLCAIQKYREYVLVNFNDSSITYYPVYYKKLNDNVTIEDLQSLALNPPYFIQNMVKLSKRLDIRNKLGPKIKKELKHNVGINYSTALEYEFIEADTPEEIAAILKARALIQLN
jgi:hypothetical protein